MHFNSVLYTCGLCLFLACYCSLGLVTVVNHRNTTTTTINDAVAISIVLPMQMISSLLIECLIDLPLHLTSPDAPFPPRLRTVLHAWQKNMHCFVDSTASEQCPIFLSAMLTSLCAGLFPLLVFQMMRDGQ